MESVHSYYIGGLSKKKLSIECINGMMFPNMKLVISINVKIASLLFTSTTFQIDLLSPIRFNFASLYRIEIPKMGNFPIVPYLSISSQVNQFASLKGIELEIIAIVDNNEVWSTWCPPVSS